MLPFMNKYRLGEIAYNAYCSARNWKSVRGETLPGFHGQSVELMEAWQKAAEAVASEIKFATSIG